MADQLQDQTGASHGLMSTTQMALVGSGFFFFLMSAICFGYGAFLTVSHGRESRLPELSDQIDKLGFFLARNGDVIALALLAIIAATIGHSLLSKASDATNYVIRPEDAKMLWPLIADEKKEAIGLYMEIARLSGLSGKFVRFGFTGLPLATVILTIVFVVLALMARDTNVSKDMMDLAKLTLGAFIGSFVQRGSDVKLPMNGQQKVNGAGASIAAAEVAKQLRDA